MEDISFNIYKYSLLTAVALVVLGAWIDPDTQTAWKVIDVWMEYAFGVCMIVCTVSAIFWGLSSDLMALSVFGILVAAAAPLAVHGSMWFLAKLVINSLPGLGKAILMFFGVLLVGMMLVVASGGEVVLLFAMAVLPGLVTSAIFALIGVVSAQGFIYFLESLGQTFHHAGAAFSSLLIHW